MARLPSVLAHIVGLVLRLSPREFRDRFGAEVEDGMERGLRDAAQRGGAMAMLGFWGRGLADALKTVARERQVEGRGSSTSGSPWADLTGDVKYALRGWRRSPGFSCTVVMTLALGLGLTSAIFAFADGYLFRPLPFPGSDRAYMVRDPNDPVAGALRASDVVALRDSAVADFGFVEWSAGHLNGDVVLAGRRIRVWNYDVSPGFRQTLRLPLFAGRDFTADDHRAGAPVVAWISHRFWASVFGRDQSVVGRAVRIEGPRGSTEVHIVGILGREVSSFDLNNPPPDWVTPRQGPAPVGPNRLGFPLVLLPEGVSPDAGASRIAAALQAVAPAADGKPREVRLRSLVQLQVGGGKPTAKVFLVGACLVLLLASLNLIHLLLSRSAARASEVATRTSLGASRWRVTRVFVVESLLFGLCGISLGLLVGQGLAGWIASQLPEFPTAGRNLSLVPMLFDSRAVAVAVVLGLAVSMAGGLWPAWLAKRQSHLRQRADERVSTAGTGRMARIVLMSELTVATVVVVGAVFISLGIYRYLNQPLGYDYAGRLRVSVFDANGRSLSGAPAKAALDAARVTSGVRHAAFERAATTTRDVEVPGQAIGTKESPALAVTPGYFETWGMRLRSGRWFEPSEFVDGSDIAVIDERFARLVWPAGDPIGATIKAGGRLRKVPGVVEARRERLDFELPPAVYVPAPESTGRTAVLAWGPGVLIEDLTARLTTAIGAAVPGSTVTVSEMTFESLFFRGLGEARFQTPVVITFGILAVTLAGIGVFGLVSFLVEQRTREFGIRMALGAKLQDIWRTVMRESIKPTLIGLALGSAGALALESVVQSSVFGWKSSGITAVIIVAIGLLAVAVVAALVPAGRAARIDPAVTLRAD